MVATPPKKWVRPQNSENQNELGIKQWLPYINHSARSLNVIKDSFLKVFPPCHPRPKRFFPWGKSVARCVEAIWWTVPNIWLGSQIRPVQFSEWPYRAVFFANSKNLWMADIFWGWNTDCPPSYSKNQNPLNSRVRSRVVVRLSTVEDLWFQKIFMEMENLHGACEIWKPSLKHAET